MFARRQISLPAMMFAGVCLAAVVPVHAEDAPVRVVVWDEQQPAQKQAYENFLGNAIADYLKSRPGLSVKSVKLDDPEQGLSDEPLQNCDVLIWWGHVPDGTHQSWRLWSTLRM